LIYLSVCLWIARCMYMYASIFLSLLYIPLRFDGKKKRLRRGRVNGLPTLEEKRKRRKKNEEEISYL
ncbi:hypothetical protein CSUI_009418, partial [Cystoisospora suis]